MIVRKIEEVKQVNGKANRNIHFNVIFDDSPDGWLLSEEEVKCVHALLGELLYPDDTKDYILARNGWAELTTNGHLPEVKDEEQECPEYIEPPEDTSSEEAVRFLPKEVTEKPKENAIPERDYTPYIDMLNLGKKPSEVMKKMEEDLNIGNGTARTYYYRNVHPYKDPEVTSESDDDPEAAKDPAEGSKLPKSLAKKIAEMPNYQTAREFIDATILQDIGQSKEVWELKAMYLKTHPNVRWR
ncbi:hypothetical protein KCG48_10610 [Proteiniclasticum sp. BAD-10]|uniref:Uncharacterized protein n=1 Tax=Proteiniclasticum sediminis TaxID=2804028 RepID=A0A941CSI0_9CLOT|nr:hypothetical protein [Proteiniclasticum sediminis]MBR0576784.1 hypothetical protein [Proteiniclasticum sediminis]